MGTSLPARASSDLLLPAPQPPLTHLGATLLRHVVVTGLRYTLYHLGLPLPDKAPIRIHELRLYLDGEALDRLLASAAGGPALAGALSEPGGVAATGERAPRGAVFFHRQRLRWARRRRLPGSRPPAPRSAESLEARLRRHLVEHLPALNDAFLDETLTALDRRRRRRRGADLQPCLGPAAGAWMRGHDAPLTGLGPPDAFRRSWAESPVAVDRPATPLGADGGRGRFREVYRQTLDHLRPHLGMISDSALGRGVTGHRDDIFFLPFELLGDLTREDKPQWLDGAVLSNRAEYFGLVHGADEATLATWQASPLNPLL